jgi:hypothetical protein
MMIFNQIDLPLLCSKVRTENLEEDWLLWVMNINDSPKDQRLR